MARGAAAAWCFPVEDDDRAAVGSDDQVGAAITVDIADSEVVVMREIRGGPRQHVFLVIEGGWLCLNPDLDHVLRLASHFTLSPSDSEVDVTIAVEIAGK